MTPLPQGYPFSALVGMPNLRLALCLNAVSPAVGGVLVRGEKGTAKSTAVRALTALLPAVPVVSGCRFSCDPQDPDPDCPDGPHEHAAGSVQRPAQLVELPVGASEERVLGSLDFERALSEGVKAYEPGLLAAAHRGVLYVDEVNLLHDHLVDLLLDAAAMGRAHVEREGVSVAHAARFLLVGTMNPEEGELRPQLLDRFGLTAEVTGSRDATERAEVIRRGLAYERDPASFAARWRDSDAELARRIRAARALLPRVRLPDGELHRIAAVCAAFEVDGLRADLVTARAALAHAAWRGSDEVAAEDVRQAAMLALPHRRRRDPLDEPGMDEERLDEALRAAGDPPGGGPDGPGDDPGEGPGGDSDDDPGGDAGDAEHPGGGTDREGQQEADPPEAGADPGRPDGPDTDPDGRERDTGEQRGTPDSDGPGQPAQRRTQPAAGSGEPFRTRLLTVPGMGHGAVGRRSRARTPHGRRTGSRPGRDRLARPDLAATLRAAVPQQRSRGRHPGGPIVIRRTDWHEPVRAGREGNLVLFVVDASGSMAARKRMRAVKQAVLSLLLDAYRRRDKVGLVTFRGEEGRVALPPTSSADVAATRLAELPTGGRTPLGAGLLRAHAVLRAERLRAPERRPLLVLVTDGRATAATRPGADPGTEARRAAALLAADGVAAVVLDCESGPVRLGMPARLAGDLGGAALTLTELAAEPIVSTVREASGGTAGAGRRAA